MKKKMTIDFTQGSWTVGQVKKEISEFTTMRGLSSYIQTEGDRQVYCLRFTSSFMGVDTEVYVCCRDQEQRRRFKDLLVSKFYGPTGV